MPIGIASIRNAAARAPRVASTGTEPPRFIKDEFDAFLEYGIPAHGFPRLRCGECGHDKLLAFGHKRRGFAHRAARACCRRPRPT
jgi:hypothetical protein